MTREPKMDVGATIIDRLSKFEKDLRADKPITKNYTVHTLKLDLSPGLYKGKDVKQLRKSLGLSQSLFATFLGVKVGTVQAWEQDRKSPQPIACRFMDEMSKHPQFFRDRIKEEAEAVTA